MEIFTKKDELNSAVKNLKKKGKSIGFVPTMGALHRGHLSLIECSNSRNDITVVSIFVNPTQFNNKNDLKNYPRDLSKDLRLLNNMPCQIVFTPTVEEMYPQEDTRTFDFGNLDKIMEGKHREGHFNGVAQIVSKLFETVEPDNAYFGQKDFQQLAIIKQLVKKYMPQSGINIVGCPIVREREGLALSSRNELLTPEQRKHATLISQTLFKIESLSASKSVIEVKQWVTDQINQNPCLEVEYFEIADANSLKAVQNWDKSNEIVCCIAVFAGQVRLIDNIVLSG